MEPGFYSSQNLRGVIYITAVVSKIVARNVIEKSEVRHDKEHTELLRDEAELASQERALETNRDKISSLYGAHRGLSSD